MGLVLCERHLIVPLLRPDGLVISAGGTSAHPARVDATAPSLHSYGKFPVPAGVGDRTRPQSLGSSPAWSSAAQLDLTATRDKVAASKRKGIWMGGSVPIGYDVRERKLLVSENEAKIVQRIFERYVELGSVRLLKRDLDSRGIVSATRSSRKGNTRGGKPFSRGALYNVLSNPIYVGEIRHRNERHPGQHEAIVSRELFERVRQQLRSRAVRQGEGRKTEAPRSPLAGKLFDESGEPLYVQGAAKGQRRYRYYISRRLVRGESRDAEQAWRISAPEIEQTISAAAKEILSDRAAIALALEESGTDPNRLKMVFESARAWIERLQAETETASALSELTERVELSREGFRVSLKLPLPPAGTGSCAPCGASFSEEAAPYAGKAARCRNADGA